MRILNLWDSASKVEKKKSQSSLKVKPHHSINLQQESTEAYIKARSQEAYNISNEYCTLARFSFFSGCLVSLGFSKGKSYLMPMYSLLEAIRLNKKNQANILQLPYKFKKITKYNNPGPSFNRSQTCPTFETNHAAINCENNFLDSIYLPT